MPSQLSKSGEGHTPGPWEQCGQLVRTQFNGEGGFLVAECSMTLRQYGANAALIAAAPDLLAALEDLVANQNGCPLPSYEAGWNAAMEAAQAALKKARGQ